MLKFALVLLLFFAAYLLRLAPQPLLICCLLSGLWISAACSLRRYSSRWTENLIYLWTLCLLMTAVCAGMTLSSPWWWIIALLIGYSALIIPYNLHIHLGFLPKPAVKLMVTNSVVVEDEPAAMKPETTPEGGAIRYTEWPGDYRELTTLDCKMPDGSYFTGFEADCCFSDDNRYFVMHYGHELRVFERQSRALYKVTLDTHPSDLIKCQEGRIYFRNGGLSLNAVLKECLPVRLVAVADLWVHPELAKSIKNNISSAL